MEMDSPSYILSWQLVPEKPVRQVHMYVFSPSVQVPPFRHGLLTQSSAPTKIFVIIYTITILM